MFMDSKNLCSILREGICVALHIFLPTLKTLWLGKLKKRKYFKEVVMKTTRNSQLTITVKLDKAMTTPKQVRKTLKAVKLIVRDVADNFCLDKRVSYPMVAWIMQAFKQQEPVKLPYLLPDGVTAEVSTEEGGINV